MASVRGDVRIGISGWRYEPWRGVFYPPGLAQHRELAFASRMLPTIEINGSFYSLQRPESYLAWHDDTPEDFVFAVKGPRYITHMLRLKGFEQALANFFASGPFALGAKLGPILWQFPPQLPYRPDRFAAFFAALPQDTEAGIALAKRRDRRLEGRSWLRVERHHALRHAVEIRHPTFIDAEFIELLREHGIALVVADTAGRWPLMEDLTAEFVYVRLHGDEELYASGYGDAALDRWAQRIDVWSRGAQVHDAQLVATHDAPRRRRDVYCYFDNDVKVHAPYDAARLAARLGVPTGLQADGRFTPPPGLPAARARAPAGRERGS
ncbi:MAG: DUF72 domain-containing protein [Burkholderiaceae bacterium]|nr:DUF72 domain-containing protein [Burkholderiaceae bacterium]